MSVKVDDAVLLARNNGYRIAREANTYERSCRASLPAKCLLLCKRQILYKAMTSTETTNLDQALDSFDTTRISIRTLVELRKDIPEDLKSEALLSAAIARSFGEDQIIDDCLADMLENLALRRTDLPTVSEKDLDRFTQGYYGTAATDKSPIRVIVEANLLPSDIIKFFGWTKMPDARNMYCELVESTDIGAIMFCTNGAIEARFRSLNVHDHPAEAWDRNSIYYPDYLKFMRLCTISPSCT